MGSTKHNGPLLDPGLCRCCRSIKRCRILTSEYTFMGEKEIYADMIMDCFGILLSHIEENERDSGVCATCVVRLRDATAFRKQVLQCEEMFLQAKHDYKDDQEIEDEEDEKKRLELEPKVEPKDDISVHESSIHEDDVMSMDYSMDEKEEPILPPIEEPKSPLKQEDTKVEIELEKNSSDDDDMPLIMKAKKRVVKKTKAGNSEKSTKVKKKLNGKTSSKSGKKLQKIIKKPIEKKDTTERDLDYMAEENLLTIIEYSYACPFKNRRNNYYCYYCKDYYPKPEDLREHTISHDTKPFLLLMGYKKMPKLDITRIDCRLCPAKIDDLNTFKDHIDKIHGKKVYYEAPDKLLLYKLTWNNLTCVMCNDVFEDFNTLNTHMVEHFSNFTCDVCGMCFLEKPRLDAHLKRHKDDERHTCEICGKVFKSNHYKDMHVDIVHKKKAIIRCPRCDECFMSYALKNKHLTEAHGQKRVYPCNLCDKVYNRQKTLTEHQRRNHQKVLKHQCEYCEQRFYLPSRLKEHMATHTGERNFRCEYCEKSYPRLKSLQYHIRTHTNDRRYRCHICGQAFIQSSGLKSHLKSHHPECEIEGCYF